ncbi:MAG: GntR family transcriptional regulator [Pseudomonadota bacterium]
MGASPPSGVLKLAASKRKKEAGKKTGRRIGGNASRADHVREEIRGAIQSGRYKPGERIREAEVADWLKVSRTPVREALRRLESEGLLTFESWRGVVVADLDRQQISELYAMREVLEGAAARLAARHIDEGEIELLDLLLERADETAGADELAAVNRQFHETIYAAAHNRYLVQTLAQLRNALALLRGTTFSIPGRAAAAAEEHRVIVSAIRERDPDKAEAAARSHIRAAQRARLRLLIEGAER